MRREKRYALCMAVVTALLMAGCGSLPPEQTQVIKEGSSENEKNKIEAQMSKENEDGTEKDSQTVPNHTEASVEEEKPQTPDSETEKETEHEPEETELTEAQCRKFTEMIREMGHYGFVLCEYEGSCDADLDTILYSGAGIAAEITEEDRALYEKTVGYPLEFDLIKIAREDIENYLYENLGSSLEDMNTALSWVYIPEADAYFKEISDTNYLAYHCVSGVQRQNQVELIMEPEEDADYAPVCRLTVRQMEDGILFLSNQFL